MRRPDFLPSTKLHASRTESEISSQFSPDSLSNAYLSDISCDDFSSLETSTYVELLMSTQASIPLTFHFPFAKSEDDANKWKKRPPPHPNPQTVNRTGSHEEPCGTQACIASSLMTHLGHAPGHALAPSATIRNTTTSSKCTTILESGRAMPHDILD